MSAHLAFVALALVGTNVLASDGALLASEHGCLNCHSAESRSAPTLQRLASRVAHDAERADALPGVLAEMRNQTGIHTHQMVTDESALAILRWMAQGAK